MDYENYSIGIETETDMEDAMSIDPCESPSHAGSWSFPPTSSQISKKRKIDEILSHDQEDDEEAKKALAKVWIYFSFVWIGIPSWRLLLLLPSCNLLKYTI